MMITASFSTKCQVLLILLMLVGLHGFVPPHCSPAKHNHFQFKRSHQIVSLGAEQNSGGSGSARFTGITGATSGVDVILSAIVSDVGSIALGLIGVLVVLGNRLADQDMLSVETLGQETRSDLLAVFACGAVLLNGLSKLDVTSALAETVILEGIQLPKPEGELGNDDDLCWGLQALLAATPAKTSVLLQHDGNRWINLANYGIVPVDEILRAGPTNSINPILDRFLRDKSKETYLPTLQALPGRVEFTYLPSNSQEALILPVSDEPTRVLVLGSDTAKSFTPRDVAWCRVVATRLGERFINY
mmetsp:Transcript_8206/g.11832  ORF Transcript_8206/g.11832 Transcript_8206/m.11832 type:complete len:303 (-) Transcript_8206:1280-2188(-)